MRTPRGCLRVVTQTLMRHARNGDVESFRTFVRSDAFLAAFNGLQPCQRQSAMRCYGKAMTLCEAKAADPLVQPGRIDAKRTHKSSWSDPSMRARLARAYTLACGDDEKAARIRGVSLGSARLAKRRHLDAAIAGPRKKAS